MELWYEGETDMEFNTNILEWTREPGQYQIDKDKIEIVTMPHTDLWPVLNVQRMDRRPIVC